MSSDPLINSSAYSPPSEEHNRKKRIRIRRIIIAVGLTLIGLTLLQNYFIQQETSSPIANNVTVVALFNVIIILLFVLLLLITRNLVKLYNERKSKIIGSKFQVKLIIAFLILALVPSILLFIVAGKLFNYSIEKWFSLQVRESLSQSMLVAQDHYSHMEKTARRQAKNLEGFIKNNELYPQSRRSELRQFLEQKVKEYALGGVVIYDNNLKVVTSKFREDLPNRYVELNNTELIKKSIGGEGVFEIRRSPHGGFLVAMEPLTEPAGDKISIWGYIVTLTPVAPEIISRVENIQKIYEEYSQQSLLKLPVTINYYITFLLITLLILFGAIWLGFYMAKGITIPIQQLAEGTRRIAEGNMNFKINVRANDEIGLLVDSFNNMTDELNESRMKIHNVHEDLKLTNIELERRRNYIESILENIGAGVISLNKKGHITTFNKAAEKILDISPVNVLGSSYKDVFDQSYHEPIRNIIKGIREESKESFEKQIELRVGENNLTLLVNVKVLRDRGKRYLGLVIVFEDLTQLIKAQKIAAWQEVAQGIAHEIKNPLTPIQLNTQRLLKKYYENKEEFPRIFDESIKIIIQEVKSMKDLLDEFMRFSRMPTPNPKPTSLHSIIDDVSLLYSNHNEKIKIIKNYDPNLNVINIDSEQMRRVFINLFENAKAAIPSKGEIQITTRLHSPSNMVKIEFSDNGVGVPPEDREKLFLPHFTTKKRGTGLGLAIVNRIIVDHNGTIHIRENPPRGTIFTIELPYSSTDLKFESENFEHKQDFRKTSPPF